MGFSIGSQKRKTTYRRFWEKVVNGENGCWEWSGSKASNGYAKFRVDKGEVLCHRFAYEQMVGPLVDGLTIDHLCSNRICVNPAHLEQVSYKENVLRGKGPAAINAAKTQCSNGHALSRDNTYIHKDRVGSEHRYCRTCSKLRTRKYRKKRLRDAVAIVNAVNATHHTPNGEE